MSTRFHLTTLVNFHSLTCACFAQYSFLLRQESRDRGFWRRYYLTIGRSRWISILIYGKSRGDPFIDVVKGGEARAFWDTKGKGRAKGNVRGWKDARKVGRFGGIRMKMRRWCLSGNFFSVSFFFTTRVKKPDKAERKKERERETTRDR